MDGFTLPLRMDGLALHFEEDMPSRQNAFKIDDKEIEHSFVEINLQKKKKKLILCSYNPYLQFIEKQLTHISNGLDSLSNKYDNYILMQNYQIIF